jgi:hypothetical protein
MQIMVYLIQRCKWFNYRGILIKLSEEKDIINHVVEPRQDGTVPANK